MAHELGLIRIPTSSQSNSGSLAHSGTWINGRSKKANRWRGSSTATDILDRPQLFQLVNALQLQNPVRCEGYKFGLRVTGYRLRVASYELSKRKEADHEPPNSAEDYPD